MKPPGVHAAANQAPSEGRAETTDVASPDSSPAESATLDPELEAGTLRFQKELLAGTVSLLLLTLLERATEPLYGYEIAKRFEAAQGNGPAIKRGTLYPALRSLESRGYLESHVEPSESGPPRRYYEVTHAGRLACAAWKHVWQETQNMVRAMLAESTE